jgi:exopolyphosphatase/guanosine-5'-triphosphate,3'-diphosphate pyrophosphatase
VTVARWEWRAFGEAVADAARRLAALEPEATQESDEVYVLSDRSGPTVKVRDHKLDVKRLIDVDEHGLEQWTPALKVELPVPAADVAEALVGAEASAPELERETYTLEQLRDEVVGPSPDLISADVHKSRRRYTIEGASTELTHVRADGRETQTVAVESEDPVRVLAALDQLGLSSVPNVSYPRGLAALLGFGAHRYAVLDVGTNSVKFHLAERAADGTWRTIDDRAEVTRLGEGLGEAGQLQEEPMRRTADAIAAMAGEARESGAEEIAAVGTAGLRIATNAQAFVDAVRERSGVEVEVIPGEEEARLAYLAAMSGLGLGGTPERLVVFDTGGGSSQFTFGRGREVERQFSVDVGAARFTERFGLGGAVSEDELHAALDAIGAELGALDREAPPGRLVGMGGANTNLAAVKHRLAAYEADVVQGTQLERSEVDRQIELYRTRSADERREIVGLQPQRAEVILAGACIVRTVMEKLGVDALTVSDRGLRHGLLVERFG